MAINYSYPKDTVIDIQDLFLGIRSSNNTTVNYSARSVSNFLNHNAEISISSQLSFKFVVSENIPKSISFVGGGGNNTLFSNITELVISIIDLSSSNVTTFLNYLVDTDIILTQQNEPNNFGHYKIINYTQNANPDFYTLELEFIGGSGNILENTYYNISPLNLTQGGGGSAIWGDITGNILDQDDLTTYLEENYYPLNSNPAGYITLAEVPIPTLQQILTNSNTATNIGIDFLNSTITGRTLNISSDGIIAFDENDFFLQIQPSFVGITSGTFQVAIEPGQFSSYDSSSSAYGFLAPNRVSLSANSITETSLDAEKVTVNGVEYLWPNTLASRIATLLDIPSLSGYVPYTGATQNVDLGEFELKAGQLTLDVSLTGTAAVGTTRWNNTIGSSETTLKGGNVILKNGVDLVTRVVNKVTPNATLLRANYQAVRVSGAQGQRLAVAYAQANNDNNSADTIGLVCEDIATNQEGFIITVGQLENINTTGSLQGETWADGDVLYLSPTTPGSLTNIKPSAPGHIVVIGYVEYAHINKGKIYVKIMNGWELDELHNVKITSPQNNDVLMYISSSDLWENKDPFDYFDAKPVTYQKHVNMPTFASAVVNNIEGVPFTVANASARTWADTNGITRCQRMGLVVSTTGNLASIRQLTTYLSRNGGFNIISAFNMAENATDTAIRFFIGVSTTISFSNIEPNTLLNCAGFCRLSTSNNIHLVHNDSSGTATTVDLGSNFPANTVSTDKYNLIWAVVPTGLYLRIERVGTAFYYETTLTSDIPSASTGLNFGAYIVDTTGASVATGFDWYGTYIRV